MDPDDSDEIHSNISNLHQSSAVKQYESTPRHGPTRKSLLPEGLTRRGALKVGGRQSKLGGGVSPQNGRHHAHVY